MVVTVAAVLTVKMPVDEIVGVIAVRNRFVPALCAVLMLGTVTRAGVTAVAGRRILCVDGNVVLVDVVVMPVVHMTVMKVIGVPLVPHRGMTTPRAVCVVVPFVSAMSLHMRSFVSQRQPQCQATIR